jgi:acetyl esterase/lipase
VVDGTLFDSRAGSEIRVYIHTPKSATQGPKAAMIYAHGGGAVLGSAYEF